MKYVICAHCTNDSKGEYTVRIHSEDMDFVAIGMIDVWKFIQ